jgi:hypothetical protein
MLATYYGKYERMLDQIDRQRLAVDLYRPTVVEPVSIGNHVEWRPVPAFEHYLFVSTRIPKTGMELTLFQLITHVDQLPLSPVIFGNWIASITDKKLVEVRDLVEKMNVTSKLRGNAGDFAAAYIDKTVMITSGAFGGTFGQVIGAAGAGMISIEIALFDQLTKCRVKLTEVELV